VSVNIDNITLSSSLTCSISLLTFIILLFIFTPSEILSLNNILSLLVFYN
jgi:NADH-ubiquinone oxidoreductase chain 2